MPFHNLVDYPDTARQRLPDFLPLPELWKSNDNLSRYVEIHWELESSLLQAASNFKRAMND